MAVIVHDGHMLRIGVEQLLTRLRAQKKILIVHKSLHVYPLDFANPQGACDRERDCSSPASVQGERYPKSETNALGKVNVHFTYTDERFVFIGERFFEGSAPSQRDGSATDRTAIFGLQLDLDSAEIGLHVHLFTKIAVQLDLLP